MKMRSYAKHNALYITMISLLFFVFACAPAPSVSDTTTPGTTSTYAPTSTDMPKPTEIIQPSVTPTDTPTPIVAGMGQVVFSESFDDLEFPFNINGPQRIESGVLVLDVPAGEPGNGIYGTIPVPPGATTILLFKTVGGTVFNIGYHSGDYETESLRRISYNSSTGAWDIYIGEEKGPRNYPVEIWKDLHLRFDTWRYFSITRTVNGEIFVKLWERDNPASLVEFQRNLGGEWGALPFTFFVDFRAGSFLLDEYQDVQ